MQLARRLLGREKNVAHTLNLFAILLRAKQGTASSKNLHMSGLVQSKRNQSWQRLTRGRRCITKAFRDKLSGHARG